MSKKKKRYGNPLKQAAYEAEKREKSNTEEFLVLCHSDNNNTVAATLANKEDLSSAMTEVQNRFTNDVLGFSSIDMSGGFDPKEINKLLASGTGMNFNNGLFKIQVIPSNFQQYKMMKKNGLKKGNVSIAQVVFK